jgi:membrane-associated phospholipid phosphatase
MNRSADRTKLIIGALAALFLVISFLAHLVPRFPGDLYASLLFQSMHSTCLLAIMKGVSYATGDWRAALIVITGGIIVWLCVGKLEASLVVLSGIITTVNEVFKIAVARPRPSADLVTIFVSEKANSFPSGHAFFR